MPTTLTYGRKVPLDGERTFWDNLEANIARDDAHTHDGSDSAAVPAKNITHGTSSLLAANWAAVAGESGTYRQLVTVPTGYTEKSFAKAFFINSGSEDGFQFFPSVERVSDTTFYVYINDNTVDVKVVYA
jgi:hypothetical protein